MPSSSLPWFWCRGHEADAAKGDISIPYPIQWQGFNEQTTPGWLIGSCSLPFIYDLLDVSLSFYVLFMFVFFALDFGSFHFISVYFCAFFSPAGPCLLVGFREEKWIRPCLSSDMFSWWGCIWACVGIVCLDGNLRVTSDHVSVLPVWIVFFVSYIFYFPRVFVQDDDLWLAGFTVLTTRTIRPRAYTMTPFYRIHFMDFIQLFNFLENDDGWFYFKIR